MWLVDQLYIKLGVYLNLGYTILIEQLKIKEAILSKLARNELKYIVYYFHSFTYSTHCSKMKMNGKKLNKCQFHFSGLLGTSPMSKQETKIIYNWTSEIIPYIRLREQLSSYAKGQLILK